MAIKVYEYPKCSTCRNALKFLDKKKVAYKKVDITETPPTKAELKKMLKHQNGEIKKLFNTSGMMYREKKIKEKLPKMTESQALDLLSKNGMLVKRPFLLTGGVGLVGFKEDKWKQAL